MKIYSSQLNYLEEIKKAEAGDVKAMIRVAFAILHGNKSEQIEPDEAELAIRYYKTAAEAGDKSAMIDLGACYMDGRGVERDVDESLRWYEKGWNPEDPAACFCLGCINRYDYLEDRTEVPTNDPERIQKAVTYFEIGERLGSSDCIYELGELYLKGSGVPEDMKMAFRMFSKAYDEIDPEVLDNRALRICLRMAECWHYGWGTCKDLNEAEYYITEFNEERRYREAYGEHEESYILERAEKEWQLIMQETGF